MKYAVFWDVTPCGFCKVYVPPKRRQSSACLCILITDNSLYVYFVSSIYFFLISFIFYFSSSFFHFSTFSFTLFPPLFSVPSLHTRSVGAPSQKLQELLTEKLGVPSRWEHCPGPVPMFTRREHWFGHNSSERGRLCLSLLPSPYMPVSRVVSLPRPCSCQSSL
jgi:hypothetical protein